MKCSRRLTAVSVTNMVPECLLERGHKPADRLDLPRATVKIITWLLVSLNNRWPS